MNYLWIAISSFLISLIFVLAALKLFPRLGLMDRPKKYGLKRAPIPYYGGLAIISAFVISLLIFVDIDLRVLGMLGGALLIGAVSFVDDFRGLHPVIRLIVQVLAGVVLVVSGVGIESLSNPFGDAISFGALSALFTVIWVVLIVNAMNWIDGLHGLSSGVGTIASFVLFFLAIGPGHSVDQSTFATIALILGSTLFAFWLFDFAPAKILMGDTGSMFIGFVLATLAIFAGGKVVTVLMVLGFPILDAFWVISRRVLSGVSPLKGDRQHLHHRLLQSGLSERQALLIIYASALLFGLMAIFLGTTEKLWAILLLLLVMAIVGFIAVLKSLQQEKQ